MLTKLEITQKKAKSTEQLDLVETIDTVDKVQRKRTFIIIAILATIGLSLAFWLYRSLRTVSFSMPEVPQFTVATKSNLDSQISSVLGKDQSAWTINLTDTPSDIVNLKVNPDSLIKDVLPQGLEIKENYKQTDTSQTFTALILVPNNQIFIDLKYNSGNKEKFISTLKKLIPLIYWSKVQSN